MVLFGLFICTNYNNYSGTVIFTRPNDKMVHYQQRLRDTARSAYAN